MKTMFKRTSLPKSVELYSREPEPEEQQPIVAEVDKNAASAAEEQADILLAAMQGLQMAPKEVLKVGSVPIKMLPQAPHPHPAGYTPIFWGMLCTLCMHACMSS